MNDIEATTSTIPAEPGWHAIWAWPAEGDRPASTMFHPIVAWVVEVSMKDGHTHEIEALPVLAGLTIWLHGQGGMPNALRNPQGKVTFPEWWPMPRGLDADGILKLIYEESMRIPSEN